VDDSIKQVAGLLKSRQCLAWLGSGLSEPAGYPNWKDTLHILAERCFDGPGHLDGAIDSERYLEAAEECRAKSERDGDSRYHRTLAALFGQRVVTRRLAYELLIKLPFTGYITTNYDPLLQYEAQGRDCRLLSYPGLLAESGDGKPVYYIHGCARREESPNGDNLVLAQSEYDEAYEDPGIVRAFLMQKLASSHVLFIATELKDPQVREALKRLSRAIRQIGNAGQLAGRPRYCLLRAAPNREVAERDAEFYRDLGIEEVFYFQRGDDRFSGLEDFLERLCREADVPLPAPIPTVKSGIEAPLGVQ